METCVPDSAAQVVDRDRDVFVTSFDLTITFAHGRKARTSWDAPWNVFLGRELIDHFEDLDDAVGLARKVSTKSGRPAWLSSDGLTFEAVK